MAYHPYSGRLKNPFDSVVNDDDEFGDFTSANVYPSLGEYYDNCYSFTVYTKLY